LFFIPFPNPATGETSPLLKLGWTLNYEMMFYLLFCALLPWRAFPRTIALAMIFGAAYVASQTISVHWQALIFYGRPITFEFVLGCAAGWIFISGLKLPRVLAIAGVAIGLWFFVKGAAAAPQTLVFCGLPAAGMVVSLLMLQRGTMWRSKFLHSVGDASYSVYCTHIFFVMAIAHLWHRLFGMASPVGDGLYVLLSVGVSIGIGIFAYRRFETPMIAKLRSFATSARPVGAPAE
jgi:peptidoglycan/LPS O-acetylase OafA/YrhL